MAVEDLQRSRLEDHDVVNVPAVEEGGQRAVATYLLLDHEVDRHVGSGSEALVTEVSECAEEHDDIALGVGSPASDDCVVSHFGREGLDELGAGRHNVDVGAEQDTRAARRAGDLGVEASPVLGRHDQEHVVVDVGVRLEVGVPCLPRDRRAELPELLVQPGKRQRLVRSHTRDGHEVAEVLDESLAGMAKPRVE